jgi:uncharacterized BrkB/YihY/UPF0761 family membrane protein
MKATVQTEVPGKWEKRVLILAAVFFVIGILLAAYAIALHLESGNVLTENQDEWMEHWAEREGLYITVRTLGMLSFMLSMGLVGLWLYLRKTRLE